MNNEWKVSSLEQSQKLVEFGVVLETERWRSDSGHLPKTGFVGPKTAKECFRMGYFPAPDVAELGELLPAGLYQRKVKNGWIVILPDETIITQPTEAQARCGAYIYLIETGVI